MTVHHHKCKYDSNMCMAAIYMLIQREINYHLINCERVLKFVTYSGRTMMKEENL